MCVGLYYYCSCPWVTITVTGLKPPGGWWKRTCLRSRVPGEPGAGGVQNLCAPLHRRPVPLSRSRLGPELGIRSLHGSQRLPRGPGSQGPKTGAIPSPLLGNQEVA